MSPYDAHNYKKSVVCKQIQIHVLGFYLVIAIRETSCTHKIHVRTIHNKKQGIKISINQEYTLSVILERSLHLNF